MSLRVGIAGYGIVGKTRHRVLGQHDAFKVVAVSDITFKENPTALENINTYSDCLLYTSPSPRDGLLSRMPSSA